MRSLRQTLLDVRTTLTLADRQRRLRQLADQGQAPMSVLFYHRVADTHPNPWTIGCQEFQRHVDFCRAHAETISLSELQARSRLGSNSTPTVSFTFDDGYAENCRFAIPTLIRLQVPCTYFVATDHVLTGKPFAHDLQRGQPLAVNSVDELRAMADGGVEIGLHTRTHFDFSRPATERQIREEIIDAADELADLIRRPIRYFAFPYGLIKQLSSAAIEAVREAGLQGYCSAYGAYNFPGNDPFHIRRIHGDPDFAKFRNWMTFDPRKVRIEHRRQTSLARFAQSSPPRPLKTMFVITSMPVGGAETLLVNLVERFDPERIQPEVACLKEPGPLGERLAERFPVHSRLLSGKYDAGILSRLSALMRQRNMDAVITVGAGDKMFWGRLAARRAGVPVICSALHSTGWPDGVGRLNRMLTPITDGFIAVADHHGVHLAEQEGFPAERVHVIRNGVDCERFQPSESAREAIREELGLPDHVKLVGIVAALRPEKNHVMFVDVAKQICVQRADVHFLIVGDGPQRPEIEAAIRQHQIEDRVHLLGTRHDTPRIVAAMDLFLLCSHNEASPVSILEALACQVPVISTRVGSVAESVIDGQTGYVVDRDDRKSMSRRALSLLDRPATCDSMGTAGRELVLRSGSLDSMVEGYTVLVETLYRQKRGTFARPARNPAAQAASASTMAYQEVN
ncbi:MAG: glycosyltransferase [Planctomycetaceae bacterium]